MFFVVILSLSISDQKSKRGGEKIATKKT